ncbi:MAG: hypothetical protein BWY38_01647 [Ignavibacteria bacterium ADurb.Bin266]|nr:MAG: hypothetical protein BWY38_01647 [Ignavibacteria bacterium ADurb.Bin266]
MALIIRRQSDNRVTKCILHRIADIPGGVTVSGTSLGGDALLEGTPLCVGSNGMYNVVKTGRVVTAYDSGTTLYIAKGHHFKVGDKIANEGATMYATINAINKTTNPDKDVITLASGFSGALAQNALLILVTVTDNNPVNHGAVVQGAISAVDVTSIKVDKGHTLAVGDYIAGTDTDPMTGKLITNINRGNDGYDIITIGTVNAKALADKEPLVVVTALNGTTPKTFAVPATITKQPNAIAVVGSSLDVMANDNLFVDAWLSCVIKEANAPVVTDAIKTALKGVIYI